MPGTGKRREQRDTAVRNANSGATLPEVAPLLFQSGECRSSHAGTGLFVSGQHLLDLAVGAVDR
jgi:hypothetical protein